MRTALVVLLLLVTTTAHAEPWHRGRYGNNRILHVSLAVGGGILYAVGGGLENKFAPETCRWCDPTAIDKATRDALVWNDTKTAGLLSNIGAYGVTPAFSIGLVLAGTLDDPSTAAVIDDVTPIVESLAVTGIITTLIKVNVGRQRPYAHFTGPVGGDDNLSFPSGHTSTASALIFSAATVARLRGYKSERYLWIGGATLVAATAYLRIAADKHYLTDVTMGGVIGASAGLTVPLLMKREVSVVPARDGVALVGAW